MNCKILNVFREKSKTLQGGLDFSNVCVSANAYEDHAKGIDRMKNLRNKQVDEVCKVFANFFIGERANYCLIKI